MSELRREGEGRGKRKEKKGRKREAGREDRRQRGDRGGLRWARACLTQEWAKGWKCGVFVANSSLDPLHDSPSEQPLKRSQGYHFVNGTPQVLGAWLPQTQINMELDSDQKGSAAGLMSATKRPQVSFPVWVTFSTWTLRQTLWRVYTAVLTQ